MASKKTFTADEIAEPTPTGSALVVYAHQDGKLVYIGMDKLDTPETIDRLNEKIQRLCPFAQVQRMDMDKATSLKYTGWPQSMSAGSSKIMSYKKLNGSGDE